MPTEVILKKDIAGLGEEGDIKKVAAGYARNYLLPFGYAVNKSMATLKRLEAEREAIRQRKIQKLNESKSFMEKLEGIEIELEANASETGKLFGSITPSDIVKALLAAGNKIEKKHLVIAEPIKTTGIHQVGIQFYGNLKTNIKVTVKASE